MLKPGYRPQIKHHIYLDVLDSVIVGWGVGVPYAVRVIRERIRIPVFFATYRFLMGNYLLSVLFVLLIFEFFLLLLRCENLFCKGIVIIITLFIAEERALGTEWGYRFGCICRLVLFFGVFW